jgi:hypothetical protein
MVGKGRRTDPLTVKWRESHDVAILGTFVGDQTISHHFDISGNVSRGRHSSAGE